MKEHPVTPTLQKTNRRAGLRFVALQLEKLAGDWAKLANYASRFNYYLPSWKEEQILEMAEQLSAAIERTNLLIYGEKETLSEEEMKEADRLMSFALYAEHSIQPIRKMDFSRTFFKQENFFEKISEETVEELFLKELLEHTEEEEAWKNS